MPAKSTHRSASSKHKDDSMVVEVTEIVTKRVARDRTLRALDHTKQASLYEMRSSRV